MTVRTYGQPPYDVVVVHGGPGAPGYMAPVATELASSFGIIEPLQSKDSLEGQIDELQSQIRCGQIPVRVIGSSWGAVLALFVASRYPAIASTVILVGSAVFDATNSAKTNALRMERMSDQNRHLFDMLSKELDSGSGSDKNAVFCRLADTLIDSDAFDPIGRDLEILECQYDLHKRVWNDFVRVRDRNGLVAEFSRIDAPVVVIHGDYDPHPLDGIAPFLKSCVRNVAVHRLERCGHYPWLERHARDRFFDLLRQELRA